MFFNFSFLIFWHLSSTILVTLLLGCVLYYIPRNIQLLYFRMMIASSKSKKYILEIRICYSFVVKVIKIASTPVQVNVGVVVAFLCVCVFFLYLNNEHKNTHIQKEKKFVVILGYITHVTHLHKRTHSWRYIKLDICLKTIFDLNITAFKWTKLVK